MSDRIASQNDYERVCNAFRWPRPESFNFAADVFDPWVASTPDRLALHWKSEHAEHRRSYAELAQASHSVADGLIALGLEPGDRVLVLLPRIVEWWEVLLGLLRAGLVAMPGTTLLTPKDLHYRIQTAEANAVITDRTGAEKIDQLAGDFPSIKARVQVGNETRAGWQPYGSLAAAGKHIPPIATRAEDPALIYFTSGTTGQPKMVRHTQASYGLGHAVTGRYWLDLTPEDLHWNISDTGWAKAAWSSFFAPFLCGASQFVRHWEGKFHPGDVLRELAQRPITSLCAAPTIYRMLIQENLEAFRPAALRHCVAAGEPLNPEVIDVWRQATGLTVRDGYGQTETVLLCGNFPGVPIRPGSMGFPAPGFDLAVIDDAGQRLPAGKEGDIAIRIEPERPVGLFSEYWKDPGAMSRSFKKGWYITGDRAFVDTEGYFWFVGRADDVITSSAYRIGPFEVESALLEHAAVAEAAVVGSPDPLRGEIVKAFVVLAKGFEAGPELVAELQKHVKEVTAPYKYPREIEFVTELPKTASGKIRRVELREREKARTSPRAT